MQDQAGNNHTTFRIFAYSIYLFLISVHFCAVTSRSQPNVYLSKRLLSVHSFPRPWKSAVCCDATVFAKSISEPRVVSLKNEIIILFGTACRLPSPSPWCRIRIPFHALYAFICHSHFMEFVRCAIYPRQQCWPQPTKQRQLLLLTVLK